MNYEFKSYDGIHFIKDLTIYNGITQENIELYNKKYYRIKLYYYKHYKDSDGFISVEKDYDYFDFDNQDEAIKIYNEIKELLRKE